MKKKYKGTIQFPNVFNKDNKYTRVMKHRNKIRRETNLLIKL